MHPSTVGAHVLAEIATSGTMNPLTGIRGMTHLWERPNRGYFVWRPERPQPVLLVAGGSGVVPLTSMVRTRDATGSTTPMRLLYSVRSPARRAVRRRVGRGPVAPRRWERGRSRRDPGLHAPYPARLAGATGSGGRGGAGRVAWDRALNPIGYVCGPTAFVEAMADLLVAAGYPSYRIRTERFG